MGDSRTMATTDNKQLMQHIFEELAKGNSKPLVESMHDDFRWTVSGKTKWSRTYEGKRAVLTELFGTLRSRLGDKIVTTARRFIAEDDLVVVEARGSNTTREGRPYNNEYCFIFRIEDGKLREVTEYMDTELITAVLDDSES
jgi:ketosteroid isomerase-like protein